MGEDRLEGLGECEYPARAPSEPKGIVSNCWFPSASYSYNNITDGGREVGGIRVGEGAPEGAV